MGTAGTGGRELPNAPRRGRRSRRLSADRESQLLWRPPGDAASSNLRYRERRRPRGTTAFHWSWVSLNAGRRRARSLASTGSRRGRCGRRRGIPWIHDWVRCARTARPRRLPREGCGLHRRRRAGPPGRGPSQRTSDGDARRLHNGPRTTVWSHLTARRRRWASRLRRLAPPPGFLRSRPPRARLAGLALRVSFVALGVMHAALGLQAFRVYRGLSAASEISERAVATEAFAWPFGDWLVVLAGL